MRTLLYVPVIHTSEDIGSLSKAVTERGISQLGEKVWSEHVATVHHFWDAIAQFAASLPATGLKIYQDGLVADGEMGAKIVAAGVQSGSRNYQIVEMLRQRGAEIVKTEDFNLVLEERNCLLATVQARTFGAKIIALFKYRLIKRRLLNRRDQFIARRISETLADGDTGILFVGAYHRVRPKLPEDIKVIEVKDAQKVREYQELLPFSRWRSRQFALLSRYLVDQIPFAPALGKSE
jgi:hypothetical protein